MAVGSKFTDNGQGLTVDLLDLNTRAGIAGTYFGAWGSGGNTPAVTDAALQAENPEARTAILAANMSQPSSDTVKWTYVIVTTAARVVQETGVLTLSAGGVLMNRVVHGSLTLDSIGDQVTYNLSLQIKDVSE